MFALNIILLTFIILTICERWMMSQRMYYYPALVGEWSIVISLCVCVSGNISLEPLDRSLMSMSALFIVETFLLYPVLVHIMSSSISCHFRIVASDTICVCHESMLYSCNLVMRSVTESFSDFLLIIHSNFFLKVAHAAYIGVNVTRWCNKTIVPWSLERISAAGWGLVLIFQLYDIFLISHSTTWYICLMLH